MFIDFKKIFSVLLILIIGAGIGIGTVKTIESFKAPKQTVSVVGTGEVDATTDQATISVQVTNKKDAQTLKNSLIKFGIPESRITQSSYGGTAPIEIMIYPRPNPTTNINFTVVLDSLKDIKKVFAAINANPNTQITNTYYSLNNKKIWESKAKEEALKDARSQVESIAKINRLRVGKLLTVVDGNNPRPYPMGLKGMEGATQDVVQTADNSTTYSEQTVKITSSYTATYELY
ncbi:conserved hypothetical protein [Candidatus Roizmanbacteria bacterium]|nr:conserved hypothetical protein [Candidatus Roizmanbacteria bacterium]